MTTPRARASTCRLLCFLLLLASQPLVAQTSYTLAADTWFNGLLFKQGTVLELHPNRQPKRGTLSENTLKDVLTWQAGSELSFHDNGVVNMGKSALAFTCPPGVPIKIGEFVVLNRDKGLVSATLASDLKVNDGPIALVNTEINLHPNGSINVVTLRDPLRSGAYWLAANQKVSFYAAPDALRFGTLRSGTLHVDHLTSEGILPKGSTFRLQPDGTFEMLTLSQDTTVQGKKFFAGTVLTFTGPQIATAFITRDTVFDSKTFTANQAVHFEPNGRAHIPAIK